MLQNMIWKLQGLRVAVVLQKNVLLFSVRFWRICGEMKSWKKNMLGSLPGIILTIPMEASTPRIPYLPWAGRNQCVIRGRSGSRGACVLLGAVKEPQDPDTGRSSTHGGLRRQMLQNQEAFGAAMPEGTTKIMLCSTIR